MDHADYHKEGVFHAQSLAGESDMTIGFPEICYFQVKDGSEYR